MNDQYDVVIVGAGPAGSTAALAIKQRQPNTSVLLVDKAVFPRDKICGDGIGPGSIVIAEELGIDAALFGDQQQIDECILYGSDNGPMATKIPEMGLKRNYGAVVRRVVFDDRLRQAAVDAGVEFIGDTRFISTDISSGPRTVDLETTNTKHSVTTRLLVGADGANSRVRKALTNDHNSDRHTSIAIRCYVDISEVPENHENKLLFEFDRTFGGGYAWLFPLEGRSANIGVGMPLHVHKKHKLDLKQLLDQYISTLQTRGFIFGERTDIATYLLPHAGHIPKLVHRDAVLIGDAASMINPLTGEGIYYGMAAGQMLAEHLNLAHDDRGLSSFNKAFNKKFKRHYANNYMALRTLQSWKLTQWAFGVLEKNPNALQTAVSMMFGHGHLSRKGAAKLAIRSLFVRS